MTEIICLGVFWKANFIPDLDLPSYIPLPGGRGVTTTARKITLAAISAVIAVSAVILLVAALTQRRLRRCSATLSLTSFGGH